MTATMLASVAALVGAAATASAHVQVFPAEAAPLDPTQWTVLVPNELDSSTVKVELQMPENVLPFSFGDTPGWTRTLKRARDQSVRSVVWEGRLAQDGFVEFSFLATTPEQEGEIEWKSIQTYENGTIVRWIGDPESDEPASVTTVSADVPRQNVGGEGAAANEAPPEEAEEDEPVEESADAPPQAADGDEEEGTSAVAVIALIAALAALGLAGFAVFGGTRNRRAGGRT